RGNLPRGEIRAHAGGIETPERQHHAKNHRRRRRHADRWTHTASPARIRRRSSQHDRHCRLSGARHTRRGPAQRRTDLANLRRGRAHAVPRRADRRAVGPRRLCGDDRLAEKLRASAPHCLHHPRRTRRRGSFAPDDRTHLRVGGGGAGNGAGVSAAVVVAAPPGDRAMPDNPHSIFPEASAQPWHTLTPVDVAQRLCSGSDGIGSDEAARRLAEYGPNRLAPTRRRGPLLRLLLQFHNVLLYVMLSAAAITAMLGHWVDTGVLLAAVLINVVIGFIQEGKAETALDAI